MTLKLNTQTINEEFAPTVEDDENDVVIDITSEEDLDDEALLADDIKVPGKKMRDPVDYIIRCDAYGLYYCKPKKGGTTPSALDSKYTSYQEIQDAIKAYEAEQSAK